jgi:hypothetical protein
MAARLEYPSTTPGTNSSASGANCESWERHTIVLQVDDLQNGDRGCHASVGGGKTGGAGGEGGEAAGGEGSLVGGEAACGRGLGWLWAKVAAAWLDPLLDEEEAGVCGGGGVGAGLLGCIFVHFVFSCSFQEIPYFLIFLKKILEARRKEAEQDRAQTRECFLHSLDLVLRQAVGVLYVAVLFF